MAQHEQQFEETELAGSVRLKERILVCSCHIKSASRLVGEKRPRTNQAIEQNRVKI